MNIAVFSIVMGYCGLAFSYMAASVLWGLPASIGEGIGIVAAVIYAGLVIGYGRKIIRRPDAVLAGWKSPGAFFCYLRHGVCTVGGQRRSLVASGGGRDLGHRGIGPFRLYFSLVAALDA